MGNTFCRNGKSKSSDAELTEREEKECKEVFIVFEGNDGTADVKHLVPMMKALGHIPITEEIDSFTAKVNEEHEGKIDFNLFKELMAPLYIAANEVYSEDNTIAAFETYDLDNNGYLNAAELRTALQNSFCLDIREIAQDLDDEDVQEILDDFDENGDGLISKEEFLKMIPALSDNIHLGVKIKSLPDLDDAERSVTIC